MSPDTFERQFLRIFDEVSNWGRWGSSDTLGTINLLTPQHAQSAVSLVQDGFTMSLSRPIKVTTGHSASSAMPDLTGSLDDWLNRTVLIHRLDGSEAIDFFGAVAHGTTLTHIDALAHFSWKGSMYNGLRPDTTGGSWAPPLSVAEISRGILGRGVLLDVASLHQDDSLSPGESFSIADLEETEIAQGVRVGSGDIVFVRTGSMISPESELAPSTARSAGPHPEVVRWLHSRQVALYGSDTPNDVFPPLFPSIGPAFHVLSLVSLGLWIIDNADLDALTSICRTTGRWEFLLMLAPPAVAEATGALVNPIAVL